MMAELLVSTGTATLPAVTADPETRCRAGKIGGTVRLLGPEAVIATDRQEMEALYAWLLERRRNAVRTRRSIASRQGKRRRKPQP